MQDQAFLKLGNLIPLLNMNLSRVVKGVGWLSPVSKAKSCKTVLFKPDKKHTRQAASSL